MNFARTGTPGSVLRRACLLRAALPVVVAMAALASGACRSGRTAGEDRSAPPASMEVAATAEDTTPATRPAAVPRSASATLLAEADALRRELVDPVTAVFRGSRIASTLHSAAALAGEDALARRTARTALAVLLVEWFTYVRLALELVPHDEAGVRLVAPQWCEVTAAAGCAAGGGAEGEGTFDSCLQVGAETCLADRTVEQVVAFGRSIEFGRFRRSVAALALDDRPAQRPESAANPDAPGAGDARAAEALADLVTSEGTLTAAFASSSDESAATKTLASVFYLCLGRKAVALEDDACLVLRTMIEVAFRAEESLPHGDIVPLLDVNLGAAEGKVADSLEAARNQRDDVLAGTWPGVASGLRWLALLGPEAGLAFDPGWSIPERFLRWSHAVGRWMVDRLDELAVTQARSSGNGSADAMLRGLLVLTRGAPNGDRPYLRLGPDAQPTPEMARALAQVDRMGMDDGFLAALAPATNPLAPPSLDALEAAARSRYSSLAWAASELPFVEACVVREGKREVIRDGLVPPRRILDVELKDGRVYYEPPQEAPPLPGDLSTRTGQCMTRSDPTACLSNLVADVEAELGPGFPTRTPEPVLLMEDLPQRVELCLRQDPGSGCLARVAADIDQALRRAMRSGT
jgi:hypothetical protein